MAVPSYTRIDATEVDSESPITASLMARLKNNVLALLGVDEAAVSPSVTLGFRGEIFATRSGTGLHNASVSGAAPGPYTWVVPTGVTKIIIEICGGGGGAGNGDNASAGGTSSVVGSVSGTICTGQGGGPATGVTPGTGGSATGAFGGAGGNGSVAPYGGGGAGRYRYATPPHSANSIGIGGFGGCGLGSPASGFGNGGEGAYSGGGAGGSEGMYAVSPGETLTLTVGAAGVAVNGQFNGSPGMIRIRF